MLHFRISKFKWTVVLVVLVVGLAVMASYFIYWLRGYTEWLSVIKDSQMAMDWEGFGPLVGIYNFTMVTAMLDIGRGSWSTQARKYNRYLLYMQRVLRLDVSMVVFVDPKGKPFVEWMRRGRENHTKVVVTSLEDLPYYRYKDRMAEIMASAEYRKDNELVAKQLVESWVADYDILQLSKLYFINRTLWENPFHTTYFMWMDGGYAHGKDVFPKNNIWIPRNLFEHQDKVTFIERAPGVRAYQGQEHRLHKMSINILAGNFFAGGLAAFRELCELQYRLVEEWMRSGVVDDDQTMYMLIYFRKPDLFRLVPGDWSDVFRLFSAPRGGQK